MFFDSGEGSGRPLSQLRLKFGMKTGKARQKVAGGSTFADSTTRLGGEWTNKGKGVNLTTPKIS